MTTRRTHWLIGRLQDLYPRLERLGLGTQRFVGPAQMGSFLGQFGAPLVQLLLLQPQRLKLRQLLTHAPQRRFDSGLVSTLLEILPFLIAFLQLTLCALNAPGEFIDLALNRDHVLARLFEIGPLFLRRSKGLGGLLGNLLCSCKLLSPLRLGFQLALNALQPAVKALYLSLDLTNAFLGTRFEGLPLRKAEDVGKNLLPLAGRLGGELIGAPLHQQRRVDEGFVVHAQQGIDALLSLTHRASR